ncbi:hypothetical protein [Paraburkholderia bryophila]|uniref:Uncharacterized protein n=1 Tax=Paraburkholderia bryophila TaxID=420952 RepID=A0A7Z0B762_9BURK|nr:hypothetical protein [Paraburkholderia bryophila]NYH23824.1 hypothetical protein [Paraburkholderia bryophila]
MPTAFIAGAITINYLPPVRMPRIDNITGLGFEVIVGDANGVDRLFQKFDGSRGQECDDAISVRLSAANIDRWTTTSESSRSTLHLA